MTFTCTKTSCPWGHLNSEGRMECNRGQKMQCKKNAFLIDYSRRGSKAANQREKKLA